jgi:hypothetical protein
MYFSQTEINKKGSKNQRMQDTTHRNALSTRQDEEVHRIISGR